VGRRVDDAQHPHNPAALIFILSAQNVVPESVKVDLAVSLRVRRVLPESGSCTAVQDIPQAKNPFLAQAI
jgi:hypothetical protein